MAYQQRDDWDNMPVKLSPHCLFFLRGPRWSQYLVRLVPVNGHLMLMMDHSGGGLFHGDRSHKGKAVAEHGRWGGRQPWKESVGAASIYCIF